LGITRPSLLTADVGGALLLDDVFIVDLGMLTDRVIADSLGEARPHADLRRFHEYILVDRKPIFLELRAYHSWIAHFDDDPRFRRDYVPIREYLDGWIRQRYGIDSWSGDYVRRDAIQENNVVLRQMQAEAASFYYPFAEDVPHPQ
jgi:hypothetical protein